MRLRPVVPLVATVLVLCKSGRPAQARIDCSAHRAQQSFANKQSVDSRQNLFGQLVLFQPVAKALDGAGARHLAMRINFVNFAAQRYSAISKKSSSCGRP